MKENSRIRFNPGTKEIEVEGSESFVKAYFAKLQSMLSGTSSKTVKEKAVKGRPTKKVGKKTKAATKKTGKRVTNIDKVVGLIQSSAEGISTTVLKKKTGLDNHQVWAIVNRAIKLGKIKKVSRGVYGAA